MSRFLDSHKVRCLIAPSSKNSFEQYCKVLISLARLSRSSLSPERLVRSFRGTKGTGAPKRGTCPQARFCRIIDLVNTQRRHFCLQIERVPAYAVPGGQRGQVPLKGAPVPKHVFLGSSTQSTHSDDTFVFKLHPRRQRPETAISGEPRGETTGDHGPRTTDQGRAPPPLPGGLIYFSMF